MRRGIGDLAVCLEGKRKSAGDIQIVRIVETEDVRRLKAP